MMSVLLAAVLVTGLAQQQTDTTFAVRPGSTLELENMAGSVVVRTWDRDAMRVQAVYSVPARLRVRQAGDVVTVDAQRAGAGVGLRVSYEITVPRSFSVDLSGMNLDATIEGVRGSVSIDNMEGSITVRGTTGSVSVVSISGAVTITDVRGPVTVSTVNQGLRLTGVRGDISAETVNGSVYMRDIEALAVRASTVNGEVQYAGTIADGGRYYLGTHNGRITMAVPERANATMEISTRMGQIDSAFPVRIGSMRNGRISFTLGTGSARVELESFNGTVRLVRP
jgi:DUF4097 and DUF4098 domain-containing protein YvlB